MSDEQEHSERELQAAQVLLKHWRARQKRRKPSLLESADGRWQDALVQAQAETNLQSAERGENDPKSRLRRAVFLAGRLQDGEALPPDQEAEGQLSDKNSKMLETQHWLELIDGKHRYGSNCENDPKSRLRRAVFLAGRLQDGEALPPDQEAEGQLSDKNSKMLETQHWLELIDGKHRYGSNCEMFPCG
ncbi:hypothetical protein RSAG8_00007, partial [Rhizoctonia solani AG-8 WAC10335]